MSVYTERAAELFGKDARLVGEDKVKEIVTEGEWDDPAVPTS